MIIKRRIIDYITSLNLPNAITIGRIILVPIIIWCISIDEFLISFILFSIAGISDFIDGWLARLHKLQTVLGAWLDPVADKLLMGSVYLTLGLLGHLPLWLVSVVILRDVFIIGMVVLAKFQNKLAGIKPLMVSKINTVAQITLAILVLADLSFTTNLMAWREPIYLLVGATTLISTFAYLSAWVKITYINKPFN